MGIVSSSGCVEDYIRSSRLILVEHNDMSFYSPIVAKASTHHVFMDMPSCRYMLNWHPCFTSTFMLLFIICYYLSICSGQTATIRYSLST